ncbi:restriction endonuclease subunit S [Francisella philomiragia]|uniref:restriction endonuclease subunit S n=1 Tax=Francisella philomiragia TaxID=28110 RepID=UPI001906D572|nr:restriction endonuclease subunit S [Francisella philomiragia]MBK2256672.1 restriction endonuclease subunit S [Francisella philomiragia]MBK2269330.1 restriction endonuclease subunit S [Francisella philomiragia]MBK2271305.1 restriction endonuclease subunit S [Francisella philomiragia]MBK2275085.1 restriction endonuclease subunit S [Francisella philomiragia]MBK2294679.1 restriction endonuclease subunit S [Francisella philomiragia]
MSNSELPKGWRECLIGKIFDLYQGLAINSKTNHLIVRESKLPLLRIKDLQENTQEIFISDTEAPQKCIATENDLIFTRTGIVGLVFMGRKGVVHNNCFRIVPKSENTYLPFYFYYFNREVVRDYLTNIAAGSVQPDMNHTIFKKIQVPLPPLAEQKAIAEVLSSLDDKIDLLHQQNQTLEDMAQTLFREWFIEKADEGWEEVKLGDYVECINGYTYKSSELMESRNALVTLKNFARDGSLRLDGFKEFTGMKFKEAQVVIDGDLVVAHTDITQNADIIGNPILVKNIHNYDKLVITMDLVKVEPLVNWIKKSYLYCLFKSDDFKFHCLCNSNGSTVLHMSKKAIPSYIFKLPPKELLVSFTKIVEDIFEKQDLNQNQIKTLDQTRDTLLPKLMSGQVRV